MFNWSSDFELLELDPQDPEIILMFYRAFAERQFFPFPDLAAKRSVWGPGPEPSMYPLDLWLSLQFLVFNIRYNFIKQGLPDSDPLTRIGNYTQAQFPAPNGFRRKFPRKIRTLTSPGINGQYARFEADHHGSVYSGRMYHRVNNAWVEVDERIKPDVVSALGLIAEGDYWGGWILNDIRDAIDQLTIVQGSPFWTSKKGERNLKSAGQDFDLGIGILPFPETRIQAARDFANKVLDEVVAAWDNPIEAEKIGDTVNYPDPDPQHAGQSIYTRVKNSGLAENVTSTILSPGQVRPGLEFTEVQGDLSIFVVEVSADHTHGRGFLIPALNGQGLIYRSPFTANGGVPVGLPAYDPRKLVTSDDYKRFATRIYGTDGKWVSVVRIWEPLNESVSVHIKGFQSMHFGDGLSLDWVSPTWGTPGPRPDYDTWAGTFTGSGLIAFWRAPDGRDGVLYDDDPDPLKFPVVSPGSSHDLEFVKKDAAGKITYRETLARISRQGAGRIRLTTTLNFSFDIVRSGPMCYSEFGYFAAGANQINSDFHVAFHALILRTFAYPVVPTYSTTGWRQKIKLFTTVRNDVDILDLNKEPLTVEPVYSKLSKEFEGSEPEYIGDKVGSIDPIPHHWPRSMDDPNSNLWGGHQGYNTVIAVSTHDFGVEGGFTHRKGYTGK